MTDVIPLPPDTIAWDEGAGGPAILLVDQTALPHVEQGLRVTTVDQLVDAIRRLAVRGAPALGVAGAYGVALAVRTLPSAEVPAALDRLASARPTAVNLAAMVRRVRAVLEAGVGGEADAAATDRALTDTALADAVLAEAHAVRDEEVAASVAMGRRGADLILQLVGGTARPRAMTVCNTGGLAAVRRGTALAVVQELHERDALARCLALETRPLLQGARLTAWELGRMGAPHAVVVDSAGPALISRGEVDVVLAGADRIAANGDTANKIGTYSLALAAARAGVPFLIVAPESTLDPATPDGTAIEIEDRGPEEVRGFGGASSTPSEVEALNPAFDVTPADLITAIVTDQRVLRPSDGLDLSRPSPSD